MKPLGRNLLIFAGNLGTDVISMKPFDRAKVSDGKWITRPPRCSEKL